MLGDPTSHQSVTFINVNINATRLKKNCKSATRFENLWTCLHDPNFDLASPCLWAHLIFYITELQTIASICHQRHLCGSQLEYSCPDPSPVDMLTRTHGIVPLSMPVLQSLHFCLDHVKQSKGSYFIASTRNGYGRLIHCMNYTYILHLVIFMLHLISLTYRVNKTMNVIHKSLNWMTVNVVIIASNEIENFILLAM